MQQSFSGACLASRFYTISSPGMVGCIGSKGLLVLSERWRTTKRKLARVFRTRTARGSTPRTLKKSRRNELNIRKLCYLDCSLRVLKALLAALPVQAATLSLYLKSGSDYCVDQLEMNCRSRRFADQQLSTACFPTYGSLFLSPYCLRQSIFSNGHLLPTSLNAPS